MFLFCLVFAMFCARLFICALWSPAGKGLTSWLSFVVSSVSLSLSHWYPGSGVVLDCIDSWSLHHYLLLYIQYYIFQISILIKGLQSYQQGYHVIRVLEINTMRLKLLLDKTVRRWTTAARLCIGHTRLTHSYLLTLCLLLLPADKICKQFGPRTSGLVWIRIVWHSDDTDGIPERIFEKHWFIFLKKSAGDNTACKITQ